MKKFLTAAVVLSISGSTAFAGGPVVIIDEPPPVVVGQPASSWQGGAGWLPLVGLLVVACAAACGSDS